MFSGVQWNHSVCLPVRVSFCVQNTSFCESVGEGIKLHSVIALVSLYIFFLRQPWTPYRIHSRNATDHFIIDGYVRKQPVALAESCAKY